MSENGLCVKIYILTPHRTKPGTVRTREKPKAAGVNTVKKNALSVLVMASILASCGGGNSGEEALPGAKLPPGQLVSGELPGEESAGDEPGTEELTGELTAEQLPAAELLSGVFTDSPVSGLNFATQSTNGVTDADGVFHYRAGETVFFSIGNVALPVVVAAPVVTPLDMAAGENIYDPSVINVARLLQSLDEDANPENGIAIPQSTNDLLSDPAVFDATDYNAVESVVHLVYGDNRQAVGVEQAVSHLVDTLSANAGGDATLEQLSYIAAVDGPFNGESLFVDQNTFSLTLDGEVHTGSASNNEGVYQLSGTQGAWFVSVDDVEDKKFACIAVVPTAVASCDDNLYQVFTDEAQAMAFNAMQSVAGAEVLPEPEAAAATDISEAIEQPVGQPVDEISLQELFPVCSEGVVDDNGDGFGWQNEQTCLIIVDGAVVAESVTVNQVAPAEQTPDVTAPEEASSAAETEIEAPVEQITPVEPVVPVAETVEEAESVDENTSESPGDTTNASSNPSAVVIQPSDITDIVVLTGQSNASGVQTDFDAALDAGNEKLFAFNEDGQWQVADLHQYWDGNLPSNFASAAQGREPFNNAVFQVGKSLTEQTDRVVGIILVTAPGEGISHWDYNSEFYRKIRNKVASALAALPQKNTVDAMIWMQGETDWLAEGTADPGATGFASTESDFYRNYYPNKLNQLISNLRIEAWYGFDAQFICAETKRSALNPHLMALNNDGDDRTSCAQASDLPTRDSDPFGNHYSAAGLRALGDRIAALYLSAVD